MPQTDIKSQLETLSVEAYETFCGDISGMFGIDMECVAGQARNETSKGLSKKYKKLASIFTVKTKGLLDGHFHLILDKEGLFTLSGTIVMLPEKRIQDMRKRGVLKDAEELGDAVGETGNLLVGSWDRIFREGMEGHGHFLQTGTFIGHPWDDSPANLGVSDTEEFMYIPFEMTVGSFPTFHCGVIFPEVLFAEKPEPPAVEMEVVEETADEAEPVEADGPTEIADADADPTEPAVAEEVIEAEVADSVDNLDTESHEPVSEVADAAPKDPPTEEVVDSMEVEETSPGGVSQSIQNMVHSPASLPGQLSSSFLNTPAQEIMQKGIIWGNPDDSVQQAMAKMQEADTGYMMIGTNRVLEGIVSWVDLIGAISIYLKPIFTKWRRPADDATLQIKLKIIMTRPVRTARMDTSVAVIMADMCQHGSRCLPIVDQQDNVQGLVTAFDIFQALLNTDSEITTLGRVAPGVPVE